ncbi:MAG: glycosyltransferase family 2 protein [Caldilinea sp.]
MVAELSICIVNHRTPQLAARCLHSIRRTYDPAAVELLLLNNTPDGVVAEQSLADFPQYRLLQNDRPLGFAANQNRLLRFATGRYWLPLNSDTEITPGALAELVRFMDTHPDCAITGPRLVHPDGSLQPSMRDFPTALTHFLEASGLWRMLPATGWVGRRFALRASHDQVRAVDWLTGACLIVRPEAARQAGLYDEVSFTGMYGEDLEWCWRLRLAGWQIYFDPAAIVMHAESASPLGDRTMRMFEGFYTFCRLHYTQAQQIAIRAATVAALAPRWLFTLDHRRRRRYAQLMRLPIGGESP